MGSSGQAGGAGSRGLDLSLVNRRKVLECLNAARGAVDLDRGRTEELAQRVARLGRVVPPALFQALAEEEDPAIINVATRALECVAAGGGEQREQCVAMMKRMVLSPRVTDAAKMQVLVALVNMGVWVDNRSYAACFRDFTGVARDFRERLLAEIAADPLQVGDYLEEMAQLPLDVRVSLIEEFHGPRDPAVLCFHGIIGRTEDAAVGAAVVRNLLEQDSRTAAAVLRNLGQQALAAETRERAAHALKTLRYRGVLPPRRFARARGEVASSLVSAIDGAGARLVWLARRRGPGSASPDRVYAVHLMLSDRKGIQDCFGAPEVDLAEYEERVQCLSDSSGVRFQSFPFEYCVNLVRDALVQNLEGGSPVAPQFLQLMDLFEPGAMRPRRYLPKFPRFNLDELAIDSERIAASAQCLDLPGLDGWMVGGESLIPLAATANRLMSRKRSHRAFLHDATDRIEGMYRQIVLSELAPISGRLRRRMELMADYLLRAPEPLQEAAMALLAASRHLPTVDGLTEANWPARLLPPDANPFLLALARRSLAVAQAALKVKGKEVYR